MIAIGKYLPRSIKDRVFSKELGDIIEIRLRKGGAVLLVTPARCHYLAKNGDRLLSYNDDELYHITDDDWDRAIQLVTSGSLYALERELRNGFITLDGGFRVGVVGTAVYQDGVLVTQKDISSLNYRVPRELVGISKELLSYIIKRGIVQNTIIFSPPGMGKTTILRDIARSISYGVPNLGCMPSQVSLIDERSELAGTIDGCPQFDLGARCDVFDGVMKHEGIQMMIRSMNPKVIITDEIGTHEDVQAIYSAANSGVAIIASAHAKTTEQAHRRKEMYELMNSKVMDVAITLGDSFGIGTVEEIFSIEEDRQLIKRPFKLSVS